jgi:subtilisin family serine protease
MIKPSRSGRSHKLVHGLAIFCLAMALSFPLFAAQPAVVVTTNLPTQIVCCNDGVDVDALIKEYGMVPTFVYRYALNGFAAPMSRATITKLQGDRRVLSVEADGIANVCDQTIPPGITRIGADTFPIGRSNGVAIPIDVGVAILDSGIDPHPDLNIYSNYWAFSSDGSDSLAHGTSVAGVLAAQDNGYGVVGVAPGVRIWNVKCIGPAPYNTWTMVINGMNYVIAHADQISVAKIRVIRSWSLWQL